MGKNSTDKLVEQVVKTKKKKENNMKKTVILTILATVAVIALFVTTFALGVKWANSQQANVEAKAAQIAKQQAVVSKEASKQ